MPARNAVASVAFPAKLGEKVLVLVGFCVCEADFFSHRVMFNAVKLNGAPARSERRYPNIAGLFCRFCRKESRVSDKPAGWVGNGYAHSAERRDQHVERLG